MSNTDGAEVLPNVITTKRGSVVTPIQTTQVDPPPDMIDLGIGQPRPDLLPYDLLRKAAAHRLSIKDFSYLAYGRGQGDGFFRRALAAFLSREYGMDVTTNDLFVTAGASQGLDLVCTLFSRPGDTIFVEEPSYFLALRVFTDHGLRIVSLPMDEGGLIVEGLEAKIVRHRPAFLYTIPTYHNPTSVTLSVRRRQELVRLSARHNLMLVADEVYQLLGFSELPPPSLAGDIERAPVISLGSFSKIMAPGLRLGWIVTAKSLMKQLIGCGVVDSGGGLNPFTSGIVRSAIELGYLEQQLERLRSAYRENKSALVHALRDYLAPVVEFSEPSGGFFIWLKFAQEMDTGKMLGRAQSEKVGYLPGAKSSSQGGLHNFARLSFAYYDKERLVKGVERLARVFA
jgi:DNA-binding transcriptional MocR family regulator